MRNWYSTKALADSVDEISIYDEIGMWGVTAKDFIGDLQALKGTKINLSINSPGGSVFDALAIYNALRSTKKEITAKVMGVAASAASLILMAGDKIVMPENTMVMVHNPWTFAMGNAEELRGTADVLDKIGASLVGTYVSRTGKTTEEIEALLAVDTWMSAEEAVAQGFADEIEPAIAVKASYDVDRMPENVRALFKPVAAAPSFVDQVRARVDAAGLSAHVDAFALDASLSTLDALDLALAEAKEVKALCEFAKVDAAPHLNARAPLNTVRAAICQARADADDKLHIQTGPQAKPTEAPAKVVVSTATVWAAHRNRT